ncbi:MULTISPECIES: hypothetical protein [environmental samples]|uniref:hypothetical protein n=1 Tax=environmental samples TaxID=876090 RepID=UPI000B13D809|nr:MULTISPECIES: hypothetical protein [environmental samples]
MPKVFHALFKTGGRFSRTAIGIALNSRLKARQVPAFSTAAALPVEKCQTIKVRSAIGGAHFFFKFFNN